MARRDYPTAGTVLSGLAILSAGAVLVAPQPAAFAGGLLLALVLPGAAATRALFPGRWLSTVEWVVFVPALSLATLALGGLGLYVAGFHLDRDSWLVLTAAIAVVAAVVGQVRARNTGAPAVLAERITFRRAVLRLMPLVLAAGLLSAAGWLSVQSTESQPRTPFTALEMVPAFASEAPGTKRAVSIGLRCEERGTTAYLLRVRGAANFETMLSARLRPGETWARRADVPATGRVTVDLFKDGGSTPYRTVFLENSQ